MEALLISTSIVALAEFGDKTQLLAIFLVAKFRKPVPVIAGIFVSTIGNHFLSALAGAELAAWLEGDWFRYLIAISFVAMGLWTLVPDKLDDDRPETIRHGAFITTAIVFFLVEIGDKTQIATVALGARFGELLAVTLGSTLGMMIANVPAVYLGQRIFGLVSPGLLRSVAAAFFILLGLWLFIATAGIF